MTTQQQNFPSFGEAGPLRKSSRSNKVFSVDSAPRPRLVAVAASDDAGSFLADIFAQAYEYSRRQARVLETAPPKSSAQLSVGIDITCLDHYEMNARLAYVMNASVDRSFEALHEAGKTRSNVEIVQDHVGNLKFASDYEPADVQFIKQFKCMISLAFKYFGKKFFEMKQSLENKKYLRSMPFTIVCQDETPHFEFEGVGSFSVEQIIGQFFATLFKTLDLNAETLNRPSNQLCVSVPTDFYTFQRVSLVNCLAAVGVKKFRIINKSSALVIPFLLKDRRSTSKILVVDFPSGTMSCSVFESKSKSQLAVLDQFGNKHISSKLFIDKCFSCLRERIKESGVKLNYFQTKSIFNTYINESAGTKSSKSKSAKPQVPKNVWKFYLDEQGAEKGESVTIDMREMGIEALVDRMVEQLRESGLVDARTAKLNEDIGDVLVCCDSVIYEFLEPRMKELHSGSGKIIFIDNDCAALGASLYVSPLIDVRLGEMLPYSIKMGLYNGVLKTLIPANTRYPCTGYHAFQTIAHNQKKIRINIYEGEMSLARSATHVCEVIFENLKESSAGTNKYKLKIEFDENGLFRVKASTDQGGAAGSSKQKLSFTIDYIPLSSVYFERDPSWDEEDKRLDRETARCLENLDFYLESVQNNIEYNSLEDVRRFLWTKLAEAKNYISKNRFKIRIAECDQIYREMELFVGQVEKAHRKSES